MYNFKSVNFSKIFKHIWLKIVNWSQTIYNSINNICKWPHLQGITISSKIFRNVIINWFDWDEKVQVWTSSFCFDTSQCMKFQFPIAFLKNTWALQINCFSPKCSDCAPHTTKDLYAKANKLKIWDLYLIHEKHWWWKTKNQLYEIPIHLSKQYHQKNKTQQTGQAFQKLLLTFG